MADNVDDASSSGSWLVEDEDEDDGSGLWEMEDADIISVSSTDGHDENSPLPKKPRRPETPEGLPTCLVCESTPCGLISYQEEVTELVNFVEEEINGQGYDDNKKKRFLAYGRFVQEVYGPLGVGNRERLPICVEKFIRKKWPSEDGTYKGFIIL